MSVRTVASIKIDKPIRDVFDHFTDIEFNAKVDESTLSARLIDGHAGTKGAVWELELASPLGGKLKQVQTVTEMDPPYRYVAEISQHGMKGPECETFEVAADGSVEVTWTAIYELSGPMKLTRWFLGFIIKRKADAWLKAIKVAIESGDPPRDGAHTA